MNAMKKIILGSLAVAVIAPTAAFADGLYFGGNYSALKYRDQDISDDYVEPDAAVLRLGVEPVDWFGLEIRGATGINADNETFPGGEVDFELDHLYGAYAKLGIPIGDTVMPYVIGGVTKVKGTADATILGVSTSESETVQDQSVGAGLDVNLSKSLALNLEYMRYVEKDDKELSAVSVGFRSAF
jgi:opacity protein-like surface antigen